MRKLYLVTIILVLSLVIAACGENNNSEESDNNTNGVTTNDREQNDNTSTENNDSNVADNDVIDENNQTEIPEDNSDDQVQKMESLDYIDFELDVKYNNDQEYEVDLELENSYVEAKLEDDLNGTEIAGDAAFDEIYPLVEQLTIDQDTSTDDAITQVLDAFDLPTDYEKFELEIKFKDGTKKKYDDR